MNKDDINRNNPTGTEPENDSPTVPLNSAVTSDSTPIESQPDKQQPSSAQVCFTCQSCARVRAQNFEGSVCKRSEAKDRDQWLFHRAEG